MSEMFKEIGKRLRAHRLGKKMSAEEIADRIGVSRAALYRLEKGDLVKIQTLSAVAELLDASLPSLLGVGVEYYSNAVAFFERMRQLEENVRGILGNFSPVSFLLLSDDYMGAIRTMLVEAIPDRSVARQSEIESIDEVLAILRDRRVAAARRRTPILSLVCLRDIERFVRFGLVGRFDLPETELVQRRAAAHQEVERLVALMRRQPRGVQIGVIDAMPAAQTFQIFERDDEPAVTLSPYRLGDQPNISSGIALVTTAPEALRLFRRTLTEQWSCAHTGEEGATLLQSLLDSTPVVSPRQGKAKLAKPREFN